MASDVLGGTLDIHGGGIDLSFPHHDNELAQSEAFHCNDQWVNYFLHAGHLHIEGQKMSKSLKNFVSIREALEKYTARQIRILFLMHDWAAILDYKKESMEQAIGVETTFKNYFSGLQALLREHKNDIAVGGHNYAADERALLQGFLDAQQRVHEAMCDSIDTRTALQLLLEMVRMSNVYVMSHTDRPCTAVLAKIARYITRMLRVRQ